MASAFLSQSFLKATAIAVSLAFTAVSFPAEASGKKSPQPHKGPVAKKHQAGSKEIPPPQYVAVLNAETGKEIICINCHERGAPASPTKLVTAIIVAKAIEAKKLKWSDKLPLPAIPDLIGRGAQALQNRGIPVGTELTVKDHMRALGFYSAADSAEALRRKLCGDDLECFHRLADEVMQEAYADNPDGRKPESSFQTPDGMAHKNTYSTPYDLAMISRLIYKHYPKVIPFFSIRKPIKIAGVEFKGHDDILIDYQREHTTLGVSYKYDAMIFGKTGVQHHPRKNEGPAAHSTYSGAAFWDKYVVTIGLMKEPNKYTRDPNAMKVMNQAFDIEAAAHNTQDEAKNLPTFYPHMGDRPDTEPEDDDAIETVKPSPASSTAPKPETAASASKPALTP